MDENKNTMQILGETEKRLVQATSWRDVGRAHNNTLVPA